MNKNTEIGRWGEEIAAAYLQRKGFSILERNFRTPEGEIDLVALWIEGDQPILVFVEVKTRTSEKYGYPEESFSQKKWDHMLKAIYRYLLDRPDNEYTWQVDVIAIQSLKENEPPDIEHFQNVVMNHDRS